MAKKLFIVLLLLALSANSLHTSGRDSGIDPGRLNWWSNSWTSRPIELSRSNAGSTGVTLTFKFQTTQNLQSGGFIEVYFPQGMTAPGGEASNKVTVVTSSFIQANSDTSIEISGVTLPSSPGAYGPFKLVTRQYKQGEIFDMTNNFASIYVMEAVQDDGNLIVTASSDPIEILSPTSLDLQMNVAFDFWSNDTIVITLDSKWSIDSDTVGCASRDLGDDVPNYFQWQGNTLKCSAADNKYYIYSIADDKDVSLLGNSIELALRISGVIAPAADWGATNYTHSVEIYRWGTMNLLRRYSGTGPETYAGQITQVVWDTHNGYPRSDIVEGLTIYMDISFKIEHPIPTGGKIVVDFEGIDVFNTNYKVDANGSGNASDYCFIQWNNRDIECNTLNSQNVEIKVNSGTLLANDVFTLSTLELFQNSSPQFQITSYWSDGVTEIDKTETPELFVYASEGVKLATYYVLTFATNASTFQDSGSGRQYMIRAVTQLQTGLFNNDDRLDFTLSLPINTTGRDDSTVYISNNSGANSGPLRLNYSLAQDTTQLNLFDQSNDLSAQAVIGVKSLSTDAAIDIQNYNGGTFGFYNNNCLGTTAQCADYPANFDNTWITTMYLPRIATNKQTRYESWMIGIVNDIKYTRFQVLSFEPSEFMNTVITRHCGNLVQFSFDVQFDVDTTISGRTYYLDIVFNTNHGEDLGSNLPLNTVYPVYSQQFQDKAVFTLLANTIRIFDQDLYDHDDTTDIVYQVYFAARHSPGNAITAKLYFIQDEDDPDVEYVMVQSQPNDPARTMGAGTVDITAPLQQNAFSSGYSITTSGAGSVADITTQIAVVQFPLGFQLNSASIASATGTQTLSNTQALSSTDPYYAFPLVFTTQTCTSPNCNFTVSSIQMPDFSTKRVGQGAADSIYLSVGVNDANNQCWQASGGNNIESLALPITLSSASPSDISARGPNSYHTDFSVSFTLSNGLPKHNKLVVVIDPDWKPTSDYCSVEGAESESDSVSILCFNGGSGNTYVVTGMAGLESQASLTLTWNNTLPPQSSSEAEITHKYLTSMNIQAYIPSNEYAGYSSDTWYYVYQQDSFSNTATLRVPEVQGKSTLIEVKTVPPNASENDVDLYLRFSLGKTIPSGSTVQIISATGAWKVPATDTKNYVFCSKQYQSVTVNGNLLTLVMADQITGGTDEVELYIIKGIDNPSSDTTDGFLFTTTYMGIVINADQALTEASTHKLTVQNAINGIISAEPVEVTNTTADEYSDYVFTFTSDQEILNTDEIWIKFPMEYEPYLGMSEIKYKWSESTNYYIECGSARLGYELECTVDQWMVRVFNIDNVMADKEIEIVILGVKNPKYQSFSKTSDFQIFTVNSSGSAKSKNRNIDGLTFDNLANNIQIKSIDASNKNGQEQGDYTFALIASHAFTSETKLGIQLPRQYNTNLEWNFKQANCEFSYYNNEQEMTEVSKVKKCDTEANMIIMQFQDFSETFNQDYKLVVKVEDLPNPNWGYSRTQQTNPTSNFDASDDTVFTSYNIWTDQFQAMINEGKQTVAKSYLNVNAAYLGFEQKLRGFTVNQYSPITQSNQIKINKGSQTDNLSISTLRGTAEPLAAHKVIFSVETNKFNNDEGKLKFTSEDNFTMYLYESSIKFRISADSDIEQGIYYINWTIQEEPLVVGKNLYYTPVKTMVEVATEQTLSFQVGSIPSIPVGQSSPPIWVSTTYPPSEEVTIELALANSATGVNIKPSSLVFGPNSDKKYFQIEVSSEFSLDTGSTSNRALVLSTSGADRGSYGPISSVSFQITDSILPETPTISQLIYSDPTRVSVSLQATSDTDGIFYWFVAPIGTDFPTADELKQTIGDYFDINQQNKEEEEEVPETTPSAQDQNNIRLNSWVAYQRRLYKQHLQTSYTGAAVSIAGASTNIAQIDDLFAETTYSAACIVTNGFDQNSEFIVNSFTTDDMPSAARITLEFNAIVNESAQEPLKNLSAIAMGIPPERMIDGARTTITVPSPITRFTWVVPAVRYLQTPDSISYASLESDQLSYLQQEVADLGITATLTVTVAVIGKDSFVDPAWDIENGGNPVINAEQSNDIQITASMKCIVQGEICGVCIQASPDNNINHNQILLGLDEDNKDAQGSCVDYADTSISAVVTITGLTPETNYVCYYMCYNNYPLWPEYISYNFESPGDEIKSVTTTTSSTEDDFAETLTVALGIILVF